jgi:hypothetical protein
MKILRFIFFVSITFCPYCIISPALRHNVQQKLSNHDLNEALQKYQKNVAHEIWSLEKIDETTMSSVIEDGKNGFKADIRFAQLPKELVPALLDLINLVGARKKEIEKAPANQKQTIEKAFESEMQEIRFLANAALTRENKVLQGQGKEAVDCLVCAIPLKTPIRVGKDYLPEGAPLKVVVLPCGHVLCDICFSNMKTYQKRCDTCRNEIVPCYNCRDQQRPPQCPMCNSTDFRKVFEFGAGVGTELFHMESGGESHSHGHFSEEKGSEEKEQKPPVQYGWVCPRCTLLNNADVNMCLCGVQRPVPLKPGPWTCKNCTLINQPGSNVCDVCGVPRY